MGAQGDRINFRCAEPYLTPLASPRLARNQTSEVFEDFQSLVRRKAPPPGPLPGKAREGENATCGDQSPPL